MPSIPVQASAPLLLTETRFQYSDWNYPVPGIDPSGFYFSGNVIDSAKPNRNIISPEPREEPKSQGASSYFETFYFRIHIEPNEIDVGNLLTSEQHSVFIWNAYLSPAPIDSFSPPEEEGVNSIAAPTQSYPYSMGALQQVEYVFEIEQEGPANIGTSATWIMSGVSKVVTFSGRRVVVMYLKPNTKARYATTEWLEWRTEVSTAYRGNEERSALRELPRLGQSYTVIVGQPDLRNVQNILFGWQNRWFGVPIWMQKVVLDSEYSEGDTFISFDPSLYSFYPGGSLIFIDSNKNYESARIQSVSPGLGVSLALPLRGEWPSGSAIYPQYVGRLPKRVAHKKITDGLVEFLFDFSFDPESSDPVFDPALTFETYDGLDVISTQPNWIRALGGENSYDYSVFGDIGAEEIILRSDSPRIHSDYSWTFTARSEGKKFHSFLGRVQGRKGAFWVPTWESDFELSATIGSSATTITTKDNGHLRFVGLNPARRNIFIQLKNRTHFCRPINSVSVNPDGDLIIDINSGLGEEVLVTDILRISYLNKTRFSTDRISFGCLNSSMSEVKARLMEISD